MDLHGGLDQLLSESLKTRPGATALGLADGSRTLTYKQLADVVETLADRLRAAGIEPGDRVGLVLPNGIEFVVAFLAIAAARAIAAPLNPAYQTREFEYFLRELTPASVLDLPGPAGNKSARDASRTLAIPTWDIGWHQGGIDLAYRGGKARGAPPPSSPPATQDVALLLHTSGSTSRPKGVPLTHGNLMASARNIVETYRFSASDRSVLIMPLFHVHGLVAGLLAPLGSGGAVYLPVSGRFSASTFWLDMIECQGTWFTAVPTIHQILLARHERDYPRSHPPPLRFIRSSSAPLSRAVLDEMERIFHAPVLEAYSMTEAAHQMAAHPLPGHGPRKPGSVGRGGNIRIAILDTHLKPLAPMQTGEICVQGDNVTRGYWNQPEANRPAFAGGWFHTGDLGYLDEDGYLFVRGRIKEIINRGGEKISPAHIDETLLAHPSVSAAVAFGVPDPKYGEEVHCAVVLKPGMTATEADLTVFCRESLAAFEIPRRIYIVDRLPLTATGKIQRGKVADHFIGLMESGGPERPASPG